MRRRGRSAVDVSHARYVRTPGKCKTADGQTKLQRKTDILRVRWRSKEFAPTLYLGVKKLRYSSKQTLHLKV